MSDDETTTGLRDTSNIIEATEKIDTEVITTCPSEKYPPPPQDKFYLQYIRERRYAQNDTCELRPSPQDSGDAEETLVSKSHRISKRKKSH